MSTFNSTRGYFGIGIEHGKCEMNIGTLWRSADLMGAAFIFTVGRRYKRQASDTAHAWRRIPLYNYADLDDLWAHLPFTCRVVGIELTPEAQPLADYLHWERAIYLLGAEDHGLSKEALHRSHDLIRLPGDRSMNVSVAGSIVMYDRSVRGTIRRPASKEMVA